MQPHNHGAALDSSTQPNISTLHKESLFLAWFPPISPHLFTFLPFSRSEYVQMLMALLAVHAVNKETVLPTYTSSQNISMGSTSLHLMLWYTKQYQGCKGLLLWDLNPVLLDSVSDDVTPHFSAFLPLSGPQYPTSSISCAAKRYGLFCHSYQFGIHVITGGRTSFRLAPMQHVLENLLIRVERHLQIRIPEPVAEDSIWIFGLGW